MTPAITAPLAASLEAVAAVMKAAHDPWWIIASAAVALHGADPGRVGDVDVLLGIEDAMRILPTIGVTAERGSAHPDFRSAIFGVWRAAPLAIEFMAGFSYRDGAGWQPVRPESRECIDVRGAMLFVPSRTELRDLLRAFGRPKDIERARRLAVLQK